MKIKRRDVEDVTILDLSGEMYGGADNMKLVETVSELVEEKKLAFAVRSRGVSVPEVGEIPLDRLLCSRQ